MVEIKRRASKSGDDREKLVEFHDHYSRVQLTKQENYAADVAWASKHRPTKRQERERARARAREKTHAHNYCSGVSIDIHIHRHRRTRTCTTFTQMYSL